MTERVFTEKEVVAILDKVWRDVLSYPWGQVCKHLIASNLISDMEEMGLPIPPQEIITAIVCADDETALAWKRPT